MTTKTTTGGNNRFWIGIGVSLLFLFFALKDIDWRATVVAMKGASPVLLLAGTVTLVAAWLVSAVRWQYLLAPAPQVTVLDTFRFICIGYLANTVLPLRLGDLARATLIGRKKGLGISRSLGSMALERVLDVLTLVLLVFILTLVVEVPRAVKVSSVILAGGGFVALLMLTLLAFQHHRISELHRMVPGFIPQNLARKVLLLFERFAAGVHILRSPGRFVVAFALSAAVWAMVGLATVVWVYAFDLVTPWYAGLFVLVLVNLGSAIPSSPGYVGVYEYLCVLALSVWVDDRNHALAYAVATHGLNLLANVVLGGYFLMREGISLKSLRTLGRDRPQAGDKGHV